MTYIQTVSSQPSRIIDTRYPGYISNLSDWEKWRLTYKGGPAYRDKYLEQYEKETNEDFRRRRRLTPVPPHARAAINDIRNSLFSRMCDISRVGGTKQYQDAVRGVNGGIDRRGKTMNSLLGIDVLEELLVMGKVGLLVDNSARVPETRLEKLPVPYVLRYQVEDILSYSEGDPDSESDYESVLLRDTCLGFDPVTRLPIVEFKRFRLMWMEDGYVHNQFYNEKGEEINASGEPAGPVTLELTRIPFVMADIGDSLLKDAAEIQICLMNNFSRAVNYDRSSNTPFYVEQRDLRGAGSHLKHSANEDGTATTGGQPSSDNTILVGSQHGRAYHLNTDRPAFINPSPEPLLASLKIREILEHDIRKSVNLAVQTLATRESAESKELDNQGLEDGLSYIGLILNAVESKLAEHFAAFENKIPRKRVVATIKYPDRYSLKSDRQRIEESKELSSLIYTMPTNSAKKEIYKQIISVLLGTKIPVETLRQIHAEIDRSEFLTSDPNTIIASFEAGLCPAEVAAQAMGFAPGVGERGLEERAERAKRIAEMTGIGQSSNSDPGARGVPELSTNPDASAQEKQGRPRRGRGRNTRVTGGSK